MGVWSDQYRGSTSTGTRDQGARDGRSGQGAILNTEYKQNAQIFRPFLVTVKHILNI